MAINSTAVSGTLTRDAELRQTSSGFAVCTLIIAVNESVKNKNSGEWEERANYFEAVLLGKRAEKLSQYLTKGTKVAIQGKLKQERWETDGQKRSKVTITIDQIELMGGKQQPKPQQQQANQQQQFPPSEITVYDEDIPFSSSAMTENW
jgi:single-strand DNA-binding protein